MAYQLPYKTSTKHKFNDYATASKATMRHDNSLFNSSLKTAIQFFIHINDDVARITKMLTNFHSITPKDGADGSEEYFQIFIHSSVPGALVKHYVSPSVTKKQAAHGCIYQFMDSCRTLFANPFCKILRGDAGVDDTLYIYCRNSLAAMMKENVHDVKCVLRLQDVYPFVHELATRLSHASKLSVQSVEFIQLLENDVREFIKFMQPVKCAIWRQKAFGSPVSFPSLIQDKARNEISDVKGMHHIFCDLLENLELCLKELESQLDLVNIERGEPIVCCWSRYLSILKELERILKLCKGLKEMFWEKMRQIRVALFFLIDKAMFALKMLQEGRHKNEELYKMLICRSRMFKDSFEYIGHASPRSLEGQLFMQFENEEATGLAALMEWFSLVCEDIFNPQNALFISCPNDGRRFFPNPGLRLDHAKVAAEFLTGMIALALLHRLQISVAYDRVFFLQLGGDISFEYIRDVDPYLYSGCKKILEIDTKIVDEDILGLTFVCEERELRSRKVVELCPNGKNTIVNSENRDNYANVLVKHCFVTSIAHQVAHFSHGFSDIVNDRRLLESFIRILDHEVDASWE
ncbi:hypothetical protein H5410_046616 [Solanum commersonii]|uniref:HECT-type E3 ubiquitin transferase n=1 Tax=Solanum commersonii TaxID=4109 RepID=A0A9J5XG80_SOLCO|nr:hypothetical protein H5410_046616 [Solanum commersonii]